MHSIQKIQNIYKYIKFAEDFSPIHGPLVGAGTSLLVQPPLTLALVFCLLGEDSVHHEGKQHPHHFHRSVIGLSRDGIRRPVTKHAANVSEFDRSPEGGRQTYVKVAPAFTAEHGVLPVVNRAETVPTGTILRSAHPIKIGPKRRGE